MNGFQSMFDVDTDAIKTFDSVFDNSAEAAEQFDNIFGAEEDDRLMEAVIGFNEDGVELPDEDELHNNEDELGEEKTTPKNFGDGIFDDETNNAPKCDTADLKGVIDRTKGPEGTKDVLDLDCDHCGVQNKGTTNVDPEHIEDSSEKETGKFNLESFFKEEFEGLDTTGDDIAGGVQNSGNANNIDDDDVEHLDDMSEKETSDIEAKMEWVNDYGDDTESINEMVAELGLEPLDESFFHSNLAKYVDKMKQIKDEKPDESSSSKEVKQFVNKYYDDIVKVSKDIENYTDNNKVDVIHRVCAVIVPYIAAVATISSPPLFTISIIATIIGYICMMVGTYNDIRETTSVYADLQKVESALKKAKNAKGLSAEDKSKINKLLSKIEDAMISADPNQLRTRKESAGIPDMGTSDQYEQLDSVDNQGLPEKDPGEGEVKDANTEFQADLREDFFMEDDDSLGLPMKDDQEGEVKDANSEFQADLDESFLMEGDDCENCDDSSDDDDGDNDDDSSDTDDGDVDDLFDDIDSTDDNDNDDDSSDDDGNDDDDDGEDSVDEAFFMESEEEQTEADDAKLEKMENEVEESFFMEGDDGDFDDLVDGEDSVDEAFFMENDEVEAELNGVIDDEEMRNGYQSAVEDHEGESAPADDLTESFFLTEGDDLEDSAMEEAIDDDALETVEDNQAEGEGDLDLDYEPMDDALFDDVASD